VSTAILLGQLVLALGLLRYITSAVVERARELGLVGNKEG